ncbi:NAD(P)H-dependent oxidoreductase [Muricauda sp. CAU 1633]|uniref:NADPH-dependent FMN reductase n=1 Tax=Allomuricauda sp. CAU 1633 TaxID=2816036 RepID=UPI001A8E9115|nr:NAD(P)H-dependent oxidoreductase [Muricauda sp. CAU 1633]MBO0323066.1 NAD(P)H-dependent oxidoreductase [Muricauda sp. CAU 1633]
MAAILAFAGSNSSTSINYRLVQYTTSLLKEHDFQLLNMTRYPFPMYSEDDEKQKGYSNSLVELKEDIQKAEGLIVSVNEHNGNPSAYFKNVLDWLSRLDRKFLEGTKVFLMSASGGKRGAKGSLEVVNSLLPRFGGEVVSTFSMPGFHENFEKEDITNDALKKEHASALTTFLESLK